MLNDKSQFTISDLIAFYGAMLSTCLALWAYYSNRPRVFITLDIDQNPNNREQFGIIIANIGTNPIIIHDLRFENERGSMLDFGYMGDTIIMAIAPHTYRKIEVSGMHLDDFEKAQKLRAEVTIAGRRCKKRVSVSK